ncbi:hypothetical protein LSH36_63g10029 [Paralvinella palmiformis]|uniref:Protein prenyltransferase alpha subunit repeat-containing protein 1 n=1 Tax=Paralvinella palmiformis TaxID=53620 RepID=A0AAD9NBS7_9ANNE|nr:hypothetical protein LSH36_63g10029 [Paralvinella palmiformis]
MTEYTALGEKLLRNLLNAFQNDPLMKQLVKEGHIPITAELRFTQLVLHKHPKSSEVFFHRKWLISRLLSPKKKLPGISQCSSEIQLDSGNLGRKMDNGFESAKSTSSHHDLSEQHLPQSEVERLLIQELQVCQDAAERYANNYHAWTHRIWIFQCHCSVKVANQELDNTKKFVCEHISDYSTYHYRQMLLQYLSDNISSVDQLLEQELDLCTEFIRRYPGHEAVWSHRRAILHQLYRVRSRCTDQTASKKLRPDATCADRLLSREQTFCDGLTDRYKSQSVIQNDQSWQMILSDRHMASLVRIVQNTTHS